jgi:hypothetical protein
MKYLVQAVITLMLLGSMNAVLGNEPSLRVSFPQAGESVDCSGFFIVAHAEDVQRLEGEAEVLLTSKVNVVENLIDENRDPIEHFAFVDSLAVINSDSNIEAVKPDAKDMTLKLFKPRKIPIVTYFECTDATEIESIFITIEFSRDGVELTPESFTVDPAFKTK